MTRVYNWIEQLQGAFEAAAKKPFDYGLYNCGLFAAECIDAMTGSERAAELKTQFNDEASALEFVKRYGSIKAAVSARLGEPSDRWVDARRGDVCLMPTPWGPGLGICVGVQVAMMAPDSGLTHMKIDKIVAVWRID